ncbi:MAG: serine/threonine-protein kinase [Pseudomonadota bacterium]
MSDQTQPAGNQPLPVGHTLLWYTLEQVLGHGGFGTTYLATDTNLNRRVAIKEYLPSIFAYRSSDFTATPLTEDHGENYQWGLNSFLNEARTLAQFKHRNVVQVQTVFEEHNTAYMVMEYEQGDPLDTLIKNRGDQLDQPFFENLLFLVMDGLQAIHDAGFIHRDIKPANLYIRDDGSPVLIDFGSARETSQQKTSEMTTLVSQGYTPLEQYSPNFGEQGPWTDIYALAASVYHGVIGSKPEDALNRSASLLSSKPDPLPALAPMQIEGYSPTFLQAIDSALALKPEDRPQSLAQWRQAFEVSESIPTATAPADVDDDATRIQPPVNFQPQDVEALSARQHPGQADLHPGAAGDFDALDWDDQHTASTHGERSASHNDTPPPRAPATAPSKSSNVPMFLGIGVLAIALAAGGWWYTQNSGQPDNSIIVSQELLDSLPRPDITTVLPFPEEIVAKEIAELRGLSTVYQNLIALDPNSGQGKEGMSFIVDSYRNIAGFSAVKYNDSLKSKLSAAIQAVTLKTDTNGVAEQLASEVESMNSAVSFNDVEPLLDNSDRSDDDNQSLVFALGALNANDQATALQDPRVTTLVRNFKQSIIKSIEDENFQLASHMAALALVVSPDDAELNLLKNHLESSS